MLKIFSQPAVIAAATFLGAFHVSFSAVAVVAAFDLLPPPFVRPTLAAPHGRRRCRCPPPRASSENGETVDAEAKSEVLEFAESEKNPASADECPLDEGGLSKQELLLQSLGFAVECEDEREARIAVREAAVAALAAEKRRNAVLAAGAVLFAVGSYCQQVLNPVTPVQLLVKMQSESAPLSVIGRNCRPTVVDFWAPWCANCREAAPTLRRIEREYEDRVNFIMVNGDEGAAWPLIERFGVDAIPHMALVSGRGEVETALIGPVPQTVLEADLDVLVAGGERMCEAGREGAWVDEAAAEEAALPYRMFDAFKYRPTERVVSFDPDP